MNSLTDFYNSHLVPMDEQLEKEAAEIVKQAEEEEFAGRIMARGFADELNKLAQAPINMPPMEIKTKQKPINMPPMEIKTKQKPINMAPMQIPSKAERARGAGVALHGRTSKLPPTGAGGSKKSVPSAGQKY